MIESNIAFTELGPESFPFTIEFIAENTGEVVHKIIVTDAGVVRIPGLAAEHGLVCMRITWPGNNIDEWSL